MIEVEGIANVQPAVAGLPERFIILRDQEFVENPVQGQGLPAAPFWDTSINYVPRQLSAIQDRDDHDAVRNPGVLARRQRRRQHAHGRAGGL